MRRWIWWSILLLVLVLGLLWWQRAGVDARCGPASAGRFFYAPDGTTLVGLCDAAGQYVPLGAPLRYEITTPGHGS